MNKTCLANRPPPCRRRFPLSLQIYVASLVIFSIATAGYYFLMIHRQQKALEVAEQTGAEVKTRRHPSILLGDPLFDQVVAVTYDTTPATDEALEQLSGIDSHRRGRCRAEDGTSGPQD